MRAGRPGHWKSADLAAAQRQTNCLHRPDDRPQARHGTGALEGAQLTGGERAVFYCAAETRPEELQALCLLAEQDANQAKFLELVAAWRVMWQQDYQRRYGNRSR